MEKEKIIKKITDLVDKNRISMFDFLNLMIDNISEDEINSFIDEVEKKYSK